MSDFTINEDAQSGEGSQSDQNSQLIESAFPDEDEETITMLDVIEREDKLEEEASAVLGNSDEKNCTYPKGYISRQAIYSCATCFQGEGKEAAICLACSLECHENHELYELYTKRNYRCDCGNSKFKPDFECKLMDKTTNKSPINELNTYNHNFSGRYCICNKRYPPDESDNSAEASDEMWQCIVCEDWYHTKHLGIKDLPTDFDEMICGRCVVKLDFVHHYSEDQDKDYRANPDKTNADSKTDSSQPGAIETGNSSKSCQKPTESETQINTNTKTDDQTSSKIQHCESDTNDSQTENKDPDMIKPTVTALDECVLVRLRKEQDSPIATNKSIFWSDCQWRNKLCRCQTCLDMYKVKDCEYLLDLKDTVQHYEAQGRASATNVETPFERGMSALNRMNRAAVVEALHGYDELKANLSKYLRKFADNKKVVREEDIHEFFEQMKSKKKPRLEYE